ncbi:MAG: hypothetical protein QNK37_16410 [Acidobacteriota bacterium]|nr:hypothetical protein [Acidobacteriota bacterium]
MSNKIIIGVHGLANKPHREELEDGWRKAIEEGLGSTPFQFEIVYWAKFLYKHPLHRDSAFSFDPLYNDQPYVPAEPGALKRYNDGWWDAVRAELSDIIDTPLEAVRDSLGTSSLGNFLLRKKLRDLQFYWDTNRMLQNSEGKMEPAADVLRNELRNTLLKYKDHQILLLTHSMGTIISYDVLRDLGRDHDHSDLRIPCYITFGSPLGLPIVKSKIKRERWDKKLRSPSVVERWVNFSDKKDPVAADTHLKGDYGPNTRGVKVEDDLVCNDYPGNPHKSYGYLRTPELSEAIAKFLA